MATFNATNATSNSADVLSSSVAAVGGATTFLVPSTTAAATGAGVGVHPLNLEHFGAMPAHTQYMSAAAAATPLPLPLSLPLSMQQQQQHHHHHQQTNSSSYTFVQIKREPCQVSEISSNNCHQQQQQHHQHQQQQHHLQTGSTSLGLGSVTSSSVTATSKTMSASTLTTLVKIEAASPKVADLEKSTSSTSGNHVPIGIAVARKRPQEATTATLNSGSSLPLQQPLNKDMNCFGIRVADLGATNCGNLYFTGNGDLMTTGTATAEDLALSAAGVNRAPSTYWQYPNALPIDSVISMSPATVGLQYSREASRGQVVLLPAAPAALGISNFPLLTPTDPFQQAAAAAAFVWPSYIPQAAAAAGPAAALQPSPNFVFPSMGTHSTLSTTSPYASTLQFYLAAAATATGSSTLCQHSNQQTSSTTTNSTINLSLAGAGVAGSTSSSSSSLSSLSSSTSSSRFLSLAAQPPALAPKPLSMSSLLLPPAALKLEEYPVTQPLALQETSRETEQQALNLMRLPTPPTSATMEPTALPLGQPLPHQILFQTAPSTPTPALLNLSMHGAGTGAADTPTTCDETALNFKLHAPLTPQTPPRLAAASLLLPQMQDVNIQTDTPVCSEDESSSCPLKATQEYCESQMPLELTKPSESQTHTNANQPNECHTQTSPSHIVSTSGTTNESAEQFGANTEEMPRQQQTAPEDLTGLVLLSNISTNVRVKQEPVDHHEAMHIKPGPVSLQLPCPMPEQQTIPMQTMMDVERTQSEPLGGLKLLCALAEQRIQEEVVQGSSLFTTRTPSPPASVSPVHESNTAYTCASTAATSSFRSLNSPTFPSMQGIELPTTSSAAASACSVAASEPVPVKRKKHKHSKSNTAAGEGRKSSRCSKKSKKKRRHSSSRQQQQQQLLVEDNAELQDEDLQSELRNALHTLDPSYAQRFGQEVFSIMDNNMRLRLADIARQYRKKKRKLDEISKHKKKKKCSKLLQQQQLQQQQQQQQQQTMQQQTLPLQQTLQQSQLTLGSTLSSVLGTSSPLRDYKFPKFSSSNLQASSFLRFPEKTHSFPPPPPLLQQTESELSTLPSGSSPSTSSFVRLEPSALDAAVAAAPTTSSSSSSTTHKHSQHSAGSSKSAARKERKLKASAADAQLATEAKRRLSAANAELQLTSEHLYRDETRVLTDMGGLFYAGVMKPLRPPDVYSITLDGERGNKSHVMSREDILKDTILEVAPKSVASVPVGTRLCAYWSQQYRCLYPGRAIESEATLATAAASATSTSSTPQDFVSVEFDDGDSGRIRLKNIRLLLSNYPIAEYTDNPLYSVGKPKRGALRTGESGAPAALEQACAPATEDSHSQHGHSMSSDNTTSLAATMELFTQRSEKKRLKKSLKKLTKAQNGIGQSLAESNGFQNGGIELAANGEDANQDDSTRKHHKHKKRKKHKKHHRKNASEEAEPSQEFMTTAQETQTALAAAPKEEVATAVAAASRVKMEIKVKAEQLDMEEETASNLMSEVSDEVKGDDLVEHNSKGSSKIAAFLPERQLWGWFGTAYRKAGVKGRARKQFYKTIKRGKETITVGDCAVFLSTGRPDRPYIGRIESMWETTAGKRVVRVAWFYHPEETTGCSNLKYPGALFESPHEDENDVQTISHRCEVLQFVNYVNKFGADSKQYQTIYDNNDTYYLAGHYNPRLQVLKLQDDIPTLEELQDTTTTTTTTTTTED